MAFTEQAREALKAKSYVQDALASIVPTDPEFDEIWALFPEETLVRMDQRHAALVDEFVEMAAKVRAIKNKYGAVEWAKREG